MVTLQGLSKRQVIIAECLWNKCQTQRDVDTVLDLFGRDARIVYELLVAETMDQYQQVEDAAEYLTKFQLGA